MIRRIQALNYRCFHYVDVVLDGPFHVLVGPNASGKSTLFDVVAFLGDLVADGLEAAVESRARNFQDLVWGRPKRDMGFELALEFDIPEAIKSKFPKEHDYLKYQVLRYEVAVREGNDGLYIDSEGGFLIPGFRLSRPSMDDLFDRDFPSKRSVPESILTGENQYELKCVFYKPAKGDDKFSFESSHAVLQEWVTSIAFGRRRSTLGNLPESPENFPVTTRVKRMLETGICKLFLDSNRLRQANPPDGRRARFVPDGSNLPWAVQRLQEMDAVKFGEWLQHVRTALRELESIRVVEREDDRHAYLMIRYSTGVEVPSWSISDGTLRLLALTLAAYLPNRDSIYLMEEPENGIHPLAVETVYQSLSSVYDSQVLIATHSPVFLRCAEPKEILCFAKNEEGATDIIRGDLHPRLLGWRNSADVDLLFASEIIG